jgi:protein-disulfide isomerase
MKTKHWVIVAVLVVVGLFWWSRSMNTIKETPPTRDYPVPKITEITEFDRVKGDMATSTGGMIIVEYSDFQCPACAARYPIVKQFLASSTNVKFVYRHFPLSQHFNAKKAAIAAEAAGLQGKFWEMHDKLFDKQSDWSSMVNPTAKFVGYAKEIGLDVVKFESDLASGDLRLKVEKDLESGTQNKVESTPTFFVQGVKIAPFGSTQALQTIVTEMIK